MQCWAAGRGGKESETCFNADSHKVIVLCHLSPGILASVLQSPRRLPIQCSNAQDVSNHNAGGEETGGKRKGSKRKEEEEVQRNGREGDRTGVQKGLHLIAELGSLTSMACHDFGHEKLHD